MSDDPAELPVDTATTVFARHRELLFSVIYSMTGSVSDTEDVLQDTWLAWAGGDDRDVQDDADLSADLLRIAVGRVLARQSGISRRRAAYVGPWLPEPLVTDPRPERRTAGPGADGNPWPGLRDESASMALMVVMETLPPLERAVFVLNEVFGYPYAEIARVLGRHPGTIRQFAHRAREHVQARRPHYPADPRLQQQLTERFIAAAMAGDLAALLELLAPDVTMWTDGGGRVRSALRPVSGRERVARFLSGYAASHPPQGLDVRYRHVNGDPSAVVFSGDSPYAVLVMDLNAPGDQVTGIYLVTNPDKLSHVRPGDDRVQESEGPA
ncbi:nuclear transport factor 2 family protein [Streptomyces cocklensis]|jgi:RNA polymerase sigma-70 factor (ECF subfamily)|uniref:RNA polymerase sigma-70 factor, ECF subfamily n=1 Tax=Actinacidiphila cocklensis TaxID=887465 RepID=A0A9W4DTJ7_9ACTN|nr:sigma factor-like helix-turn-helix DNA-binding protein [Actinacidiphila cocklensis]MDD1058211.1 nuclear transport factor 2 family protein [Actinacidiphila cocklensis]CAG6393262.1 RNA polymerase sigma-70 factor, ECF subfamily [Actinacidiphila cocklensis]